ncbi:phospholipase D-like domain-containing protein [Burkholderia pseudomallei]|uniref:phospholipase D-like domain-containing protein n=1 Tax=Burkholderia pseudomallei TaxID=28450 RepID=UPI0012B6D375
MPNLLNEPNSERVTSIEWLNQNGILCLPRNAIEFQITNRTSQLLTIILFEFFNEAIAKFRKIDRDEIMGKNFTSKLMISAITCSLFQAHAAPQENSQNNSTDGANNPNPYFLTQDEITASRAGVQRTEILPYTLHGNSTNLLVNGDEFFTSLFNDLSATRAGDIVWMTGWDINKNVMLLPDPTNPDVAALTKIQTMLIAAIKRNVAVRILLNANVYSPLTAIEFCAPLNRAAGHTVCAPDSRHNSNFGNLHQKAWTISRNGETIAYVGSMDISAGRYDTRRHDQDEKWKSQPAFTQGYYGWTGGMVEVKGPAVLDIARHMYQQISDPKNPFPGYTLYPISWPDPKVGFYQSITQVQLLLTAGQRGGVEYGYYSNWAPQGELSILSATVKAIKNAKQYIFISDQFMWYPPIMDAIAEQLPKVKAVVLVTNSADALDHEIAGYDIKDISSTRQYYQYKAWKKLMGSDKVFAYQVIKEGRDAGDVHNVIYTHWKALIVDDVFAIIGSAGVEQAGMTNDVDMSVGIYDPQVVKSMRKKLWSEYLYINDPYEDDPIADIKKSWPLVADQKGRVRQYWPANIGHKNIYDYIFDVFEPCGYLDVSQCQRIGSISNMIQQK